MSTPTLRASFTIFLVPVLSTLLKNRHLASLQLLRSVLEDSQRYWLSDMVQSGGVMGKWLPDGLSNQRFHCENCCASKDFLACRCQTSHRFIHRCLNICAELARTTLFDAIKKSPNNNAHGPQVHARDSVHMTTTLRRSLSRQHARSVVELVAHTLRP